MGLKKYLKKQWLKLSKFGRKPKPTDSRSWVNPKQNKSKKSMARQIIIKLLKTKNKEKALKAPRKKWHLAYKGKIKTVAADFSSETIQVRKKWHNIFRMQRKRTVNPVKISFKNEGKIKTLRDEERLSELVASRPTLKEWLKEVLYRERER